VRIKWGALIVVISFLGTALAMAVSGRDDTAPEVVGAVDKKAASDQASSELHESAQPAIRYDLSAIKRVVPDNLQSSQMFQSKTWYSPPPPTSSASSLPPAPPSAPPLTFTFLGRMIDGNERILFLFRNGHQYTVKANDVIDDTYRVDKITNSNAVLTYLPMNVQQTLAFNSNAIGSTALTDPIPPATTPSSPLP